MVLPWGVNCIESCAYRVKSYACRFCPRDIIITHFHLWSRLRNQAKGSFFNSGTENSERALLLDACQDKAYTEFWIIFFLMTSFSWQVNSDFTPEIEILYCLCKYSYFHSVVFIWYLFIIDLFSFFWYGANMETF